MRKSTVLILSLLLFLIGQAFLIYFPMVISEPPAIQKGIAMVQPDKQADLPALGASWYYTWDVYPHVYEDARHIPMSRCGLFDPAILDASYSGYVILFNEPWIREPNGCDLTIEQGVERYSAFIAHYPHAKIVFGNSPIFRGEWDVAVLTEIKARGLQLPSILGVHAYYFPTYPFWFWRQYFEEHYTNVTAVIGHDVDVWVTEFAIEDGNTDDFRQVLEYLDTRPEVKRVAPFTNRAMYDEDWWPEGWVVELVNDDGALTALGQVYADWHTELWVRSTPTPIMTPTATRTLYPTRTP